MKKQAFLYIVGGCGGYQEWDGGKRPCQVPTIRKNIVYSDFTNQNLKLTCLSSCASNFLKNISNNKKNLLLFLILNNCCGCCCVLITLCKLKLDVFITYFLNTEFYMEVNLENSQFSLWYTWTQFYIFVSELKLVTFCNGSSSIWAQLVLSPHDILHGLALKQ